MAYILLTFSSRVTERQKQALGFYVEFGGGYAIRQLNNHSSDPWQVTESC
jgi:hypothetical protein